VLATRCPFHVFRLPPPPSPPPAPAKPPVYVAEVFVPGELGYPCIRIPSVILGGDNRTLLAFAECRNFTGDGCLPVGAIASPMASRLAPVSRNANRDLCQKRSLDGGVTWGQLTVIARNGAQASPVWDAVRSRMLLQYMQLSPPDTMQMISADNGLTWTTPKSVCADGMSGACGGAVGPGVGIQLTRSKHAGRILFIGHFGAYVKDRVWVSVDGGATFSVSGTVLAKMDEAQLVELPDGRVMANMRNDHLNASCQCRGVAISEDGGATFGPITFDPELVSPVCAGSILAGRNGGVFFANPASTVARANGVVRRSADGVHWAERRLVWPGAFGYSCLSNLPDASKLGLLWETDGDQCHGTGASCRTVFSTFPATL